MAPYYCKSAEDNPRVSKDAEKCQAPGELEPKEVMIQDVATDREYHNVVQMSGSKEKCPFLLEK